MMKLLVLLSSSFFPQVRKFFTTKKLMINFLQVPGNFSLFQTTRLVQNADLVCQEKISSSVIDFKFNQTYKFGYLPGLAQQRSCICVAYHAVLGSNLAAGNFFNLNKLTFLLECVSIIADLFEWEKSQQCAKQLNLAVSLRIVRQPQPRYWHVILLHKIFGRAPK